MIIFIYNKIKYIMSFITNMFSSSKDTSHKRVLGSIGFLSLIIFLFTCSSEHKDVTISAIEYMTIATTLGTVVEKFVKKLGNVKNSLDLC